MVVSICLLFSWIGRSGFWTYAAIPKLEFLLRGSPDLAAEVWGFICAVIGWLDRVLEVSATAGRRGFLFFGEKSVYLLKQQTLN